MSVSTDIEKKSLEAHVELCTERYNALESKLDSLEKKVEKLEGHIIFIRDSLANNQEKGSKQLIAIGTTLVAALIGGIITLLVHLNK